MSKKIVIVFEGIEGSGKTFHIKHVSNYLKKKKINDIGLMQADLNQLPFKNNTFDFIFSVILHYV